MTLEELKQVYCVKWRDRYDDNTVYFIIPERMTISFWRLQKTPWVLSWKLPEKEILNNILYKINCINSKFIMLTEQEFKHEVFLRKL